MELHPRIQPTNPKKNGDWIIREIVFLCPLQKITTAQGSWALPLLHERISSGSSPILQAASQLKLVCEQSINPVLAVLDREYGNANWVLAQADIQADCLMRVRKNACLWSAPPAYSGRGRPRKHGQKMSLNDPTTSLQADTGN